MCYNYFTAPRSVGTFCASFQQYLLLLTIPSVYVVKCQFVVSSLVSTIHIVADEMFRNVSRLVSVIQN